MFALTLLKRVPPVVTAFLFYWVLPVVVGLRFLVSTTLGTLGVAALLYWYSSKYGDPKPYTMAELAIWLDDLPIELKSATVGTLVTVLGFLVAFHTASINWKAETRARLKIEAASDIEVFFNEGSKLIVEAQLYVESLVEIVNKIQRAEPGWDPGFSVQRALEKAPGFLATRDRLSAMSIEVHRLLGRHHPVLSTVAGVPQSLERCAEAFSAVTQAMWIRVPVIVPQHPDPIGAFIGQVNVTDCAAFVTICEAKYDFLSGMTGAVRGLLLAPVLGVSFATVLSLRGKRAEFIEAMSKLRGT